MLSRDPVKGDATDGPHLALGLSYSDYENNKTVPMVLMEIMFAMFAMAVAHHGEKWEVGL